jgi:hypothetical protein
MAAGHSFGTLKFMAVKVVEIPVKGVMVPSVEIAGREVIVTGGWVKTALIRDEEFTQSKSVDDPEAFLAGLKQSGLHADVLTFFQRPPDVQPKFSYPLEWENYAAVPVTTFEAWWDKLPQESRKNTRRAAKRGVEVKVVPFDDELARGIHKICNETPVRQGRPFWHYGKDFETVKREHATYAECSDFIAAYFEGELIGFIKLVHVDRLASMMAILALNSHYDKRPMNALLAKTMEVCVQKGATYFVYGNYVYGNKKDSSLVEFKRRNGFEKIDFPRYYVPLTWQGKIYVALRLYRGLTGLLPAPLLNLLLQLRAKIYARKEKVAAVKDE